MRIRTIKPEFYLHEGLYELEIETLLPIRVAFSGLWCAADREGRFKWEPRKLGIQILPYDGIEFSRVLDALWTRGFVLKYASETSEFGFIPSFPRHQVINNRERPSELPEPLSFIEFDACLTRDPRVTHAGKAEGKGREGKGKDLMSDKSDECYPEIVETLWKIFPAKSKTRSSKKELDKALKATKPKPSDESLVASLGKWALCHEWTKDGGQFAPGAHLWIQNRKWESEPQESPSKQSNVFVPLFPGHRPDK
jgi:hypothetical protein